MRIDTLDPTREPAWDDFVGNTPDATIFHTSAWAMVLKDTYGFQPRYLVARNGSGGIIAGIPLFEARGRRLVSLPFSDQCPPLLADDAASVALVAAVKSLVVTKNAKSVELRGQPGLDLESQGFHVASDFVQHTVMLDGSIKDIEARFHPSTRSHVRQAIRSGVTVRRSTSAEDMRRFFLLQTLTRKKHGLLPQPWRFFDSIRRGLLEESAGHLLLAEHEGQVIAADVLLVFRDALVHKFSASDPRFLRLRPNHLLHRSAMELGLELGCRTLDLGRSDASAKGLRKFKANWGSVERPLPYFHYPSPPANDAVANASSFPRRTLAFAVRFAPPWALRRAGAVLYKYAS